MKISESELNYAYNKVNELKATSESLPNIIEVDIERNPLTDEDYFDSDTEFVTPFKLSFMFDKTLGQKGSYVLITENLEIVGEDNEIIED